MVAVCTSLLIAVMSTLVIDDQDPSLVKYTGSWVKGGTSNENAGTVTSSTVVGDSFTVSFNGTDIGVYGTLDSTSGGVVTSYSVDGAPEAQVTSTAGSGDTYHQLFWQSSTFPAAQHNLVVKLVKLNTNSEPGEGTIWFDYFQVTEALSQATSSSSTGSATSSASPTTTQTASAVSKKKSIAPIVGGVVAGFVFLLLAVFLILFVLRRRRRERNNSSAFIPPKMEIDGTLSHTLPGYMPLPQGNSRVNVALAASSVIPANNYDYRPPPNNAPFNDSLPPGQSVLYYNNQPQSSLYGTSSHSPLPAAFSAPATMPFRPSISKDSESTNPSLTLAWMPEPVQHVDSGLRVVKPQSDVMPAEIPPVYSEQ